MSLTSCDATAIAVSFPRVSGDEPASAWSVTIVGTFSPRERG